MKPKRKDLHLYLTPEDQKKFDAVKRIMVKLGMPISSSPQAVIRFALNRTAQQEAS
jgi:hypothetical protein